METAVCTTSENLLRIDEISSDLISSKLHTSDENVDGLFILPKGYEPAIVHRFTPRHVAQLTFTLCTDDGKASLIDPSVAQDYKLHLRILTVDDDNRLA